MPINKNFLAVFESENIYHIYNRANDAELLFRTSANYIHFLRLFSRYILPLTGTYSWCLLPNHFHFLVRINSVEEISEYITSLPAPEQTKSQKRFLDDKNVNTLLEMELKRFFTSYAMSFNKMFNRKGNLFSRTFKRVKIEKDVHFTQAIVYIHANAQKHGLVNQFNQYKWTSYHSVISEKPTMLLRNEILNWFGNKQEFIKTQKELANHYYSFSNAIENDVS